jgi:hypothetical protein
VLFVEKWWHLPNEDHQRNQQSHRKSGEQKTRSRVVRQRGDRSKTSPNPSTVFLLQRAHPTHDRLSPILDRSIETIRSFGLPSRSFAVSERWSVIASSLLLDLPRTESEVFLPPGKLLARLRMQSAHVARI